jgi:hypothetical protein
MNESERLERGYRRILACYPRAFRAESTEEIVAVLLSTAREGQQRVGLAEAADLIRGALRMHRGPRLPAALRGAVRRTYAGAVLEFAVLANVLVTLASLTSPAARRDPYLSAARWHAALTAHPAAIAAAVPVLLGLWAWLACANARGHHGARITFRVVHVLITLAVIGVAFPGLATFGESAVVVSGIMNVAMFGAFALVFHPSMTPLPYRPHRQLNTAPR